MKRLTVKAASRTYPIVSVAAYSATWARRSAGRAATGR